MPPEVERSSLRSEQQQYMSTVASKKKRERKRKRDDDDNVNMDSDSVAKKKVKNRSQKQQEEEVIDDNKDDNDEISPFHIQTSSLYVPLSPVSQKHPVEGICAEHLSPLILTYYAPFKGLILSYSEPILSSIPFPTTNTHKSPILLKNIDEYGGSWGWLTAEFLVLRPQKGTWLEGRINLQNDGFLGLVCWNLINASIERQKLPNDWKWKDCSTEITEFDDLLLGDEGKGENVGGYYVDGKGERINDIVRFRVLDVEISQEREAGGFLTIVGTLLSE